MYSQFSSVAQLCPTPRTIAHQASLSITKSWSLLKLISMESVMPSNHLILCHPLLLLPSIFPSIRVFSNESALLISWPNIRVSPSTYVYKINKFILIIYAENNLKGYTLKLGVI